MFTTFRVTTLAGLLVSLHAPLIAQTGVPEYRLGDVATQDVVAPVPLLVVNPEGTEALRRKVAQQVHFIVRHAPRIAAASETDLRATIDGTWLRFMQALQRELGGSAPSPADIDTPAFERALRTVAGESAKDLPLDRLARIWVRGLSDEMFVATMREPLRAVMAQPIVDTKTDSPLPASQPIRLIAESASGEMPAAAALETAGTVMAANKVLSLWRARRLVETHFPADQQDLGRFVASFVRTNAFPDPALTEIARARRSEGVTVNDTYEPGQVVVRQGQTIDRKALAALAVLREKSMIGTLQTRLEQERSVAGEISGQTKWITTVLAAVGALFLLIVWRMRSRPVSTALVPAGPAGVLPGDATHALPGGEDWRQRALVAEGKVERAHEVMRSGALGWMRDRVFRMLSRHRSELLQAQQKAELEMRELEQRLTQLHAPLQDRIVAYEQRIEELERELAAKGEENRELIGARIRLAKQQLNLERERERFATN